MSLANNPRALAALVQSFGGKPIEHHNFRFEIPLSQVREVVPQILKPLENEHIGCRRVDERRDQHPTRHEEHSIVVYRRPKEEQRLSEMPVY
jgi:hypothetical protein